MLVVCSPRLLLPLLMICWSLVPNAIPNAVADEGDEQKEKRVEIRIEIDGEGNIKGERNGEAMDEEELQAHVLRWQDKKHNQMLDAEGILALVGDDIDIPKDKLNKALTGKNMFVFRADDGDGEGEGFAWTSNDGELFEVKKNFLVSMSGAGGKYFVGVMLDSVGDALRSHVGLDEGQGLMVQGVIDDSPAEAAGLQANDILVEINGDAIDGEGGLVEAIQEAGENGDKVRFTIIRAGKEKIVKVKPGERKEDDVVRLQARLEGSGDDVEIIEVQPQSKKKKSRKRIRVKTRNDGDSSDGRNSQDLQKEVQELRALVEELRKSMGDDDE